MNTKSKLAIFDIDGTLTDSVQLHQSAFVSALEEMGLADFDTNWGNYTHHTDSYIFNTIFTQQFGRSTTSSDMARFEIALDRFITTAVATNPLREIKYANYFLQQLTHHPDYDIVFATGSLLKPARQKLALTNISASAELIAAANEIVSRDELVLHAIEKAMANYGGRNYTQIVSFGDGLWDYNTSRNLDIDFIGIGNHRLREHGVEHFFPHFDDPALFALMHMEYGK